MFRVTARTVLELGSELISSDIIAFYELVKNAFDAQSKTGADIHFKIVLRRNDYLDLKARALRAAKDIESKSSSERNLAKQALDALVLEAIQKLDVAAGTEKVEAIKAALASATSLKTFVKTLDSCYSEYNSIEILDSGTGMSLDELSKNYLTIGTASRKAEVERALASGASKTPFLGEKGIGRLSVMRLGDFLHLETARRGDVHLSVLDVDWSRFADMDAMVDDIKLEATVGPTKPSADWSGTRICISNLMEDWTEKRVKELAESGFSRLSNPFEDPKLRPRIALHWNGNRVTIPWMDRALIENAHGIVSAKYSIEDGAPFLNVHMEAINLGYEHPREVDETPLRQVELESLISGLDEHVPRSALVSVGPFEFKAYWYNRRHLAGIEGIGTQRDVRDLLRRWSGIKLYRDGFRVFPYGEESDDWLALDRRALGRPGYVLNKTQFLGHVRISRSANPGLVDQTNREGLRASPEEQVLVSLLKHVVTEMLWEFFREIDRKYKRPPIELGDVKSDIKKLESRANTAIGKVRKFVPKEHREIVSDLQLALAEFHDLSTKAQARIEQVESDSKQMLQMAGVGLMVEVVAHELARASESALYALEALKGKDLPAAVKAKLETLRAEMKSVSKRLRVLDQLSVSGRQRSETFDLGELLADLKEGHDAQLARDGIELKIRIEKGPIKVKLVKGMVVQILENLLSNSFYWMQIRKMKDPQFIPSISIVIEQNPLTLRFSDNGPGIATEHREKVFRPFWSLKEKSKRRGLGLYIARENAVHLGGQLLLSDKTIRGKDRLYEFVLELPDSVVVR